MGTRISFYIGHQHTRNIPEYDLQVWASFPFLKKVIILIFYVPYVFCGVVVGLGFFFCYFYMNIFLAAVLCYRARWTLFWYNPSLWRFIQWGCSWVYAAAILLCAVCLLTTQHEASRVKAVFKDFWRPHPHLLYLYEIFLCLCSPKL